MTLGCPQCRRVITVPDDRAQNPNLKIKCSCGVIFPLGAGLPTRPAAPQPSPPEPAAAAPAPQPATPPAPVARTTTAAASGPASGAPPARPAPSAPSRPETAMPASAPQTRPPAAPPATRPTVAGAAAAAGFTAARARFASNYRVCAQHPRTRSEFVCPTCKKGHCGECVQIVRKAGICPTCEGLCVPIAEYEERQERERLRARSLMSEIGTIVAYPLTDPLAYVLLSVLVGAFALASRMALFFGGGWAFLFSQGLLMAYAFNAVDRVASGRFEGYIPQISDISEIINPVRLGFAAFVASNWPLILVILLSPGLLGTASFLLGGPAPTRPSHSEVATEATPDELAMLEEVQRDGAGMLTSSGERIEDPEYPGAELEEVDEELATPPVSPGKLLLILVLLLLGLLWKLAYSPIALTVAAMNRTSTALSGMLQTLNPVLGVQVISSLGALYWQVLAIYTVVSIAQVIVAAILNLIPFVGVLFIAFVDAYAYLAIGCALGFAVFKRAPELGLD